MEHNPAVQREDFGIAGHVHFFNMDRLTGNQKVIERVDINYSDGRWIHTFILRIPVDFRIRHIGDARPKDIRYPRLLYRTWVYAWQIDIGSNDQPDKFHEEVCRLYSVQSSCRH